jgi:hypothetical protein
MLRYARLEFCLSRLKQTPGKLKSFGFGPRPWLGDGLARLRQEPLTLPGGSEAGEETGYLRQPGQKVGRALSEQSPRGRRAPCGLADSLWALPRLRFASWMLTKLQYYFNITSAATLSHLGLVPKASFCWG